MGVVQYFLLVAFLTVVVYSTNQIVPKIFVSDGHQLVNNSRVLINADEPAALRCSHTRNITWYYENVRGEINPIPSTVYSTIAGQYLATVNMTAISANNVGRYSCVDNSSNCSKSLLSINQCPQHFTTLYVFIIGSNVELLAGDPTWHNALSVIRKKHDKEYHIPCKPSHPDVRVTLWSVTVEGHIQLVDGVYSPLDGYLIPGKNTVDYFNCTGIYKNKIDVRNFIINDYAKKRSIPVPTIILKGWRQRHNGDGDWKYDFARGSNLAVECICHYGLELSQVIVIQKMEELSSDLSWRSSSLLLHNVTDPGHIKCYCTDHEGNASAPIISFTIVDDKTPYLETNGELQVEKHPDLCQWKLKLTVNPMPHITWTKNSNVVLLNGTLPYDGHLCSTNRRYQNICVISHYSEGFVLLRITNPIIEDIALYTFTVQLQSLKYHAIFNYTKNYAPRKVEITATSNGKVRYNTTFLIKCSAEGYPAPELILRHPNGSYSSAVKIIQDNDVCNRSTQECIFATRNYTTFRVILLKRIIFMCMASNNLGSVNSKETLVEVYDTPTNVFDSLTVELKENENQFLGYGLTTNDETIHKTSVLEGSNLTIQCRSHAHLHTFPYWEKNVVNSTCRRRLPSNVSCDKFDEYAPDERERVTDVSRVSTMELPSVVVKAGCQCWTCKRSGTSDEITLQIQVKKKLSPVWVSGVDWETKTRELLAGTTMELTCSSVGVPHPTVMWNKDEILLRPDEDHVRITSDSLEISKFTHNDSGLYTCIAINDAGSINRSVHVVVASTPVNSSAVITSLIIISVLLMFLAAAVSYKIHADNKMQKEIRKQEQELFEACDNAHFDPDVSPVDQVEQLPYIPSYNIDKKRLIFERQLGVGAFGRVFQARLSSPHPDGSPEIVAVKAIKSKTNNDHLRAFRSEIKILMYIGRHRNIINLIGVCCNDMVERGEMLMVVEYCLHKSLLDYMRSIRRASAKHETFTETGTTLRREYSNEICKGYNSVCVSSIPGQVARWRQESEYQNSSGWSTADSELPLLRGNASSSSNKAQRTSVDKVDEKKLLDWCRQIANGMAFLSGKKIIHGDLAARNILLTKDGEIKIADFGLAKDVYNKPDNTYKLNKDRLFAIRWTSLETLKYSEFSSQSDVWSFGVVLWEIYSLGEVPYPDIELSKLLEHLKTGSRLQKPKYSDKQLYHVMLSCWLENPSDRPTFESLEQIFHHIQNGSQSSIINGNTSSEVDQNTTCTYLPMTPDETWSGLKSGKFSYGPSNSEIDNCTASNTFGKNSTQTETEQNNVVRSSYVPLTTQIKHEHQLKAEQSKDFNVYNSPINECHKTVLSQFQGNPEYFLVNCKL